MEEVGELLGDSIIKYTTRTGLSHNPVIISRAVGGSNAVASGAAYAAMKALFSSLNFPLAASFSTS